MYFNSITNGPFLDGENLTVNGNVVTITVGDSGTYSGEGYPCTDQVGRGHDQASEPVYIWNNTDKDGRDIFVGTTAMSGYIEENRDYYNIQKPYSDQARLRR